MTTERVHKSEEHDVFIGRGQNGQMDVAKAVTNNQIGTKGWLGNPYPLNDYSREQAIELYERDLEWLIDSNPVFRAKLKCLYGKKLACYCSERQDCHGDVLVEKINELYWEDK